MIGDAKGYRFEPNHITVKIGDGIKFTNITGGPHNVTFWADSIPAGAQAQLQANMPSTISPLTGPLLINANDSYTVSFAGVKPGTYHFYCTPHLALGMIGVVTVQ
jgi:plastocyanin